ncbi:MAG: LpqB family beta-propeller domain-containing protein [Planctomycetaceae bacterium]|nr:LpqB family beta-propeller domain-containing protein [Planctomycetaceae bacterium]
MMKESGHCGIGSRLWMTVALFCQLDAAAVSQETDAQLRVVIVSYAQKNGNLQLYRVMEDGTSARRITDGQSNCMMPAWSPSGKQVVYVRQSQTGLDLWLCDPDGHNHVRLTESGRNRVPSWAPDSKHIVWMVSEPQNRQQDPAASSQLRIMNTETMESRRLFSDAEQTRFSNAMPVISPDGRKVAFVSNRSGELRVWVSNLDGSDAQRISPVPSEKHAALGLPIEQKVPSWSPDGKWIAHWEGVEMTHMSRFTGRHDPQRDQQIAATFHVWVVGRDGKGKRKAGRGDDPNWSPDGFVTRSFPDPRRGGVNIMMEDNGPWRELPIVPAGTTRYGRFTWKPL